MGVNGDPLRHLWHTHISLFIRPMGGRFQVRLLRAMGASHGRVKHARDLMRQEEKAAARDRY